MTSYINPEPPATDPEEISQETFDYIRTIFPNYDPQEGQLATVVIVALALRAAEILDLIPLIPKSVFRYFGANVIGFPPVDGTPAVASLTIYVRDNAGYTVPADTVFAIRDDDGDDHLFNLDEDAVVPVGETSVTGVIVTAEEDGTQANEIVTGTVTLVDALDDIVNVTHQGTTSGGTDPEDDDTFLNRLTIRLGLVPRPIWASDFAALTMTHFPEVYRAMAIDNYQPGQNQIDKIDFSGTVSGGTYVLSLDGPFAGAQLTVPINWNAPSADVKTAIENLASWKPGEVEVTLGPGPADMLLEYKGRYAATPVSVIVTSSLTGGGTVAIVNQQASTAADPTKIANITVAGQYESGDGWSDALKADVNTYLQSQREWGFIVNVIDPTFNDIDATFAFTVYPTYDKADVRSRAETAVAEYFNSVEWGAPPGDPKGYVRTTAVYHWEVVGVLQNVEGLNRLTSLTLGLNGGAQTAADQTLTGTIPLPRPGNIIGIAS